MAKLEHLHKLFDAHTKDLNEILVNPEEIIACPICLRVFDRNAVDQKIVNDGHVWPKDIRKLSRNAGHMQVILCKSCNEKASRADKQLQLYEKLRKGEETGELHGVRLVRFLEEGKDKPIELRVNVQLASSSLRITGRTNKDNRIMDINPNDRERLEAIFRDGKKADVTIHPLTNYKPGIVPAALITSAYLMAYHALGYRYILQDNIQIVRDYILKSFESELEEVDIPTEENFTLEKYVSEYYPDPKIAFIFPYGATAKVYISVSFLNAAIRLPFVYEPSIFNMMVNFIKDNGAKEFQKIIDTEQPFIFKIPCTKTVIHDCLFDYLLGKSGNPAGKYNLTVGMA